MNTLPADINLYYILVFVFLASFSSFVLVFSYLIYAFTTDFLSRKNRNAQADLSLNEALQTLDAAKKQSFEIIRDANKHASEIINSSRTYQSELQESIEKRLHSVTERQSKHFEEISSLIMTKYQSEVSQETSLSIELLKTNFEKVRYTMNEQLQSFVSDLREELRASEESIKEHIKQRRIELDSVIDSYKKDRLENVDKTLHVICPQIVSEVFARNLSDPDKEKLILLSLEQIKSLPEVKSL